MSPLDEFLAKNTIKSIEGSLPLVHSTKSLNLRELVKASGLTPTACREFDEKLLYFFLGRPAYRWRRPEGQPQHWELPTCFVFDKIPNLPIRRVFPFDSGAYGQETFPSYIQNIPRSSFESTSAASPNRIVSAIYGDFKRYVAGNAKSEKQLKVEFDLGALDAEILAIRKLAEDGTPAEFDDRRFSIELQTKSEVNFEDNPPSAVILPTVYLEDAEIQRRLNDWGSEIINYDIYNLSLQLYFGAIFFKFVDYCRAKGFDV